MCQNEIADEQLEQAWRIQVDKVDIIQKDKKTVRKMSTINFDSSMRCSQTAGTPFSSLKN